MRCTLQLPRAAMFPSENEQRRPPVPEGAAVSPEPLHRAVDLLSRSAVVAMPTDTQYALSAVATNREAVAAVFKIKQRPAFENLPIFHPLARLAGARGGTARPSACAASPNVSGPAL